MAKSSTEERMHILKRSHSFLTSILLISYMFLSNNIYGQNYVLFHDDFEQQGDTLWNSNNARQVESQSFKGQKSFEVSGNGKISYEVEIPKGVTEIIVRGWIRFVGTASKSNFNKGAFISIENAEEKQSSNSEAQVNLLNHNSSWTNMEEEIKLPAGIKKIRIVCQNTLENSAAYFDEIEIAKRQTGFVKSETAWANSIRQMKEKSSRLVKNGDFEGGAVIWDPYWGFELSNISHTGSNSCMIRNSDSGAWKGTSNLELFKIPAGTKKLKISVWIKAEDVAGGLNSWEKGAMLLSLTDELGNEVPGGDAIARTSGNHDWRKFESFFTISERATNFKILMQLAASTGKIYFDDIVAQPMTDEEFYLSNIVLKNPGFENLLSGWPAYAGDVTNEVAHSGKYSLKVAGETAGWEMRMQTISLVRNKKEFTLSGWIKTENVTETPNSWEGARVYVEFKDINGIVLSSEGVGRAVGNTDWEKFSKKISIPNDAVEVTISCGRANVSGNAYFDDLSLEY